MSQASVFSEVLLSDGQLVQQKSMVDMQEIKPRLQGMSCNRDYSHSGDLMSGTEANRSCYGLIDVVHLISFYGVQLCII